MKTFCFVLTFFLLSRAAFAAEVEMKDQTCKDLIKASSEREKHIKRMLKDKKDIDNDYFFIEKVNTTRAECQIWKKLKISNEKIESYKKIISTIDRSFDLPESKCTTVEIDTSNMPKNHSQKNLRWCFAWSGTNLLSFNEEIPLSFYDMASQYHLYREDRKDDLKKNPKQNFGLSAGAPVEALEIILSGKGICTEAQTNFANEDWGANAKVVMDLIAPEKSLNEIACKHDLFKIESIKNLSSNIINVLGKLSSDNKLAVFLDLVCDRHQLKKKYETHLVETGDGVTPENLMSELDGALEIAHQPVSVGYSSDVLSMGQNFVGTPDHESTVIGRKYNKEKGQCEYLIKNSWGDDCDNVAPSIKCENGNYWLSRTTLQKNSEDLHWITPIADSPK